MLHYLLEVMKLPWVALGVIPSAAQRDMWLLEQFTVFDDNRVDIKLLSAQVTVTVPNEITLSSYDPQRHRGREPAAGSTYSVRAEEG